MQAAVYPSIDVGNQTALNGLLNVTADDLNGSAVRLPYDSPDGDPVFLGDQLYGYPPTLYPNLTYSANISNTSANAFFQGQQLDPNDMLLLGPLIVNDSYALLSATIGIINNTSRHDILGWLTVLVDASMIFDIQNSPEGLGKTGETLLIGPTRTNNRFESNPRNASAKAVEDREVRFVLPPNDEQNGHRARELTSSSMLPFSMGSFPAVVSAWTKRNGGANNAGAYISTRNEQGQSVSTGYAALSASFVDWVLIIEQSHGEVVAPIRHLRDVVLICVFCVMGALLLIVFPLAHYSVAPIRQLRAATLKTVEPYQPEDASMYSGSGNANTPSEEENAADTEEARKEGFLGLAKWSGNRSLQRGSRGLRRRTFRIPSKVPERKHFVTDELTDLTSTFNEMADELTMQYERLEERVKERTAELEKSKQAAEAANQSKTLFIANISHELKTPLNGILGLATVCMAEEDMTKVRSTLSTIYKSGDLLLHLLTDLLTFSKNEVGQQLAIDETEFRLNDLSTQLVPTFEKQAREAKVDLKVQYLGTNDAFGDDSEFAGEKLYGPAGTGRIRDMCLWGDKNRVLQVLMNFVSNSLKFTPAHGSVTVRIRCVGLLEQFPDRAAFARKSSIQSRKSRSSSKKVRMSDTSLSTSKEQPDTPTRGHEKQQSNSNSGEESKLSIHVAGGTAQIPKIAERRRSMSPPPLNTKDLAFEFEVEDTGPGIPEDQQKKIFEPFVQGDLGLSKKYGGTGLGLSICVQLASLMGGDVSLESKVGKGSKFTMKIPLRFMSERAASMASSHRSHSKASSLVGQGLRDDPNQHLHHPRGGSTTSLDSTADDDHRLSSTLADVPRIVGFSAPYVAKETKPETATKARLNEMKKAESEAAKQGKKVRVLVAEDNPVNQEVVLRMLKLEDVYGKSNPSPLKQTFLTFLQMSQLRGMAKKRSIRCGTPWPAGSGSTSFSWTYRCQT